MPTNRQEVEPSPALTSSQPAQPAHNSPLDVEVSLDVKLLGLDKTAVFEKAQVLLEQQRKLPVEIEGVFIENEAVPLGGSIKLALRARRGATSRSLFSESRLVELKGKMTKALFVYNKTQAALGHIPLVGRTIEKIAPDAWQNVTLKYEVAVRKDRHLDYCLTLGCYDGVLHEFEGTCLL